MNKLIAGLIGVVAVFAGTAAPAGAVADRVSVGAAAFEGKGYWGSPLTNQPTTMEVGLSGTVTGAFATGSTTVPSLSTGAGTLACTGAGVGTEAIAAGAGNLGLTCAGGDATPTRVACPASASRYQRVGTTTVYLGFVCRLQVGSESMGVSIVLTYEGVPDDPTAPKSWVGAGTLAVYAAEQTVS